jgi:membrane protease YdiL (CAAX protease family)
MISTLKTWPAWIKVSVYFIILWLGTLLAGTINVLNDFSFFLAVAVLVAMAFTGSLRKATVGCGFFPQRRQHLIQFAAGLAGGICMLLITVFITFLLTGDNWKLNHPPSLPLLLLTFAFCLWSAFVQEAVFRGFPFQVMLQRYAPWIAQLVIAIPFGLMHVKQGMSGQEMFITMLCTGMGSLLFGLAYIRTRNLMLPIGLHCGWNYAQALIPRTQPGNTSDSLVIVSGNVADYNFLNVIAPYLLVVSLAILLLLFTGRNFRQPQPSTIPHPF